MQVVDRTLDERLKNNLKHRISDDQTIDPMVELERVAQSIGLSSKDAGGKIKFKGLDPVVDSTLPLATATSVCLMLKAIAVSKIWRLRGGDSQDLSTDLGKGLKRLSALYKMEETLNGYNFDNSDPQIGALLSMFKTKDGRFIMPDNNMPQLRDRMEALLNSTNNLDSVAKQILNWDSDELEKAATDQGLIMGKVRTLEEFMKEPVYQDYLKDVPLVEVEKIGDSEPEPFTMNPEAPLAGMRVLGMAHIIAGAATGRALACHGADVLNIWRPNEYEFDDTYNSADVGMRSARIDYKTAAGRQQLVDLVKNADIFVANRRQKLLRDINWTPEDVAEIRPGIIYCNISFSGDRGPWMDRVGYDQVAGAVTGVGYLEGTKEHPQLPVVNVVNDSLCGWLAAAGVMEALIRRSTEGGSYRVHVSLCRTSLWLLSMGLFDKAYAKKTAGSNAIHQERPADMFVARTPMGFYRGYTDQVKMSSLKEDYKTVLVPRGSSYPVWLEHGVEPYWQPEDPDANINPLDIQGLQAQVYAMIDQIEKANQAHK